MLSRRLTIRVLLRQGCTQQEVARRVGVSQATVSKVARQPLPPDELRELERAAEFDLAAQHPDEQPFAALPDATHPPAEIHGWDKPPGFDPAQLKRCPGCGGLVYLWPCLACDLLSEQAHEQRRAA